MNQDELIRMANQIADFFQSYPKPRAVNGVATHIEDFWDPRMKGEIATLIRDHGDKLSPVALDGLKKCLS